MLLFFAKGNRPAHSTFYRENVSLTYHGSWPKDWLMTYEMTWCANKWGSSEVLSPEKQKKVAHRYRKLKNVNIRRKRVRLWQAQNYKENMSKKNLRCNEQTKQNPSKQRERIVWWKYTQCGGTKRKRAIRMWVTRVNCQRRLLFRLLGLCILAQDLCFPWGHATDWFQIGKGVRQGCLLSPCLFNLYAEYIMRNTGLEET